MEKLDNIYESVLSESNFKVGDTIYHPKYGKGVLTFVPGDKSYLRDTAKADFGDNKGQPVKIKDLKKESLSSDIDKFKKGQHIKIKKQYLESVCKESTISIDTINRLLKTKINDNTLVQGLIKIDTNNVSINKFYYETKKDAKNAQQILTKFGFEVKISYEKNGFVVSIFENKKEYLSEDFNFTSPYDIQKFLKSNKNFAKEWTVEDMAAFTKQDVKDIKRLAQNAYAQNLINFNNGKYSDLKESLSEDFKMGDIVSFIDPDWKKNYGNSKYEVGIVTSSGKIKLQDIKTKQRLPYTFEPTSLKKESLSSDSISESINTDLYNKFKKIDSNIIQSLRELREFVAKYYPRLVGNVRNVVDEYSDAVYDIEYNLSHSKESLSKLDNLYESVLKEGNGFLDYKGDWRGDNVKYLENDYKLWDNPQKYLPELKDFVKRIDYAISQNKDSPLIMSSFEKSKKEADNLIKYFEDIIPITKQITKGKSIEDVKSILNKSKYWNWSDRDLMNNNAKVRGPMDLYIDFENDKVVKYNF